MGNRDERLAQIVGAMPQPTVMPARADIAATVDSALSVVQREMARLQKLAVKHGTLEREDEKRFHAYVKSLEKLRELDVLEDQRAQLGAQSLRELLGGMLADPEVRLIILELLELERANAIPADHPTTD